MLSIVIICGLIGRCLAGFATSDVSSYSFPSHKMGLDDQSYVWTESVRGEDLAKRNDILKSDVGMTVHRYNVFWNSFESSGTPSSDEPLDCQTGYYQIPTDASGLRKNGGDYFKYRCMSQGLETVFKQYLKDDQDHGWESAAIIWCAPPYARDPGCLGQPDSSLESAPDDYSDAYANFSAIQGSVQARVESVNPVLVQPPETKTNSSGAAAESALDSSGCSCAPADVYVDDYQDYIQYLGDRVNSGEGRFSSYIVWNECANSFWTDFSPRLDVTQVVTPEGQSMWVKLYADLIRRTVAAAEQPALVYASTDRWWGVPPVLTSWGIGRNHIGSQNLLLVRSSAVIAFHLS